MFARVLRRIFDCRHFRKLIIKFHQTAAYRALGCDDDKGNIGDKSEKGGGDGGDGGKDPLVFYLHYDEAFLLDLLQNHLYYIYTMHNELRFQIFSFLE